MSSLKQQTLSGAKWTTVDTVASQGIQFIIGIVLARLLSPEDFGVVGLLTVFIVVSQAFIDGGFSNALIRKQNKSDVDYSTAFYFNILVGVVCYGILFVLSPWVAVFFKINILSPLLRLLGVSVLLNSLSMVQVAKLTSDVDFKGQAIASLISIIISGGIGIAIAYNGYGVWALVWQTVIMAACKSLIVILYARWIPILKFSKSSFKYLFSYGSKLVASNLLFTVYNQLTSILIGKFYTSADLGYFTRGRQFANLPGYTVTTVLGRVTFPILSKIQDNDIELIRVYRRMIRFSSLICIYLFLLIAALAKSIVILLLTEKWIDCVIYLQLFCTSMLFDHISRLNLNLLQIKGRTDLYLRLEFVKRIISIAMMLIALPFGIVPLILSINLYAIVAFFANTYYTGKLFHLSCWIQLQDMAKYLGVSILVCIPAYLLTFLTIVPNVLTLGISVFGSTFAYWLLLRKDDQMIELFDIVKNIIR